MPKRKLPLTNNYFYHIFNRGINKQKTFLSKNNYQRFLALLKFYKALTPPHPYSQFTNLSKSLQQETLIKARNYRQIDIIAYCLIPNHFHLLLRQKKQNGISKFLANLQNSYTRYFNLTNQRSGPLFNTQFKAVLIKSNEQLLHVSRYIHLNPYSSNLLSSKEETLTYPYSSIQEYLTNKPKIIDNTSLILDQFKPEKYKKFVLNNADYQRNLEKIKHLTLE